MTKLFQMREDESVEELLKQKEMAQLGQILREGGLVAFPTETVYGLGANAFDAEAGKKIYRAKGRPSDNPLIVHISKVSMLAQVAREIDEEAKALIEAFFPGPLTLIVKKSENIPDEITAGLDTVAVRMPSNKIARALIESAGVPIAAPSANLSGRPSPTHYKYVVEDLDGRVDAIICSQDSEIGIESTILDISEKPWKILRPGAIGPSRLKAFCKNLRYDTAVKGEVPKAPGMKYRHYCPDAEVQIIPADLDAKALDALIHEYETQGRRVLLVEEQSATVLAREIFKIFRMADERGYDLVLVREVKGDDMSDAVMNRIHKAAQ